jgi:hypothetical protein
MMSPRPEPPRRSDGVTKLSARMSCKFGPATGVRTASRIQGDESIEALPIPLNGARKGASVAVAMVDGGVCDE